QELNRIDVVFNAGTVCQAKPLIASTVNALMREGTSKFSSLQISETLDYYGAFLEQNVNHFNASFSLYSLNKHTQSVIEIFLDILFNPIFPEKEFELYQQKQLQNFKINQQKVGTVARNKFPSLLYGQNHPYGRVAEEKDFLSLQISDVKKFYQQFYQNKIAYILVSGKINDVLIQLIQQQFGTLSQSRKNIDSNYWTASPTPQRKIFIEKKDAIQSAIRIGRVLFSKNHTDYFNFQVLNTVLGGYFGSRLMSNIREEKGYTYGIGSGILSLQKGGMFFITTETGAQVTALAVKEIYAEIKKLREELVSEEELSTVKNYMLGVLLKDAEGPFAQAEKFKGIYDFGLNYDYYTQYFNAIKNTTSKKLRELANQYLKQEDLVELVVGKME
ncbi:MAG: insulinase family protein, partial [Bacteroidia bacterium]|nr:insulinase family protein [Bacteroidia bacterium]